MSGERRSVLEDLAALNAAIKERHRVEELLAPLWSLVEDLPMEDIITFLRLFADISMGATERRQLLAGLIVDEAASRSTPPVVTIDGKPLPEAPPRANEAITRVLASKRLQRSVEVRVRMTVDQRRVLEAAAARLDIPLAQWLVDTGMRVARREITLVDEPLALPAPATKLEDL